MPEFSSHNATVSMGTCNLPPHHSDLACFLVSFGHSLSFGTVDECNTFAKVKVCFLLIRDSFNPDKGGVGLLIPQTSLVAKDNAFGVQTKHTKNSLIINEA